MTKQAYLITLFILIFTFSCSNTKEKQTDSESKIEKEEEEEEEVAKIAKIVKSPIVGILKSMEESDFWGREYLYVDIDDNTMSFEYYDFQGDSFSEIRKLIGKKIVVNFNVEQTLQEFDLHINSKTIYGEYGRINTEEAIKANNASKIEGTLLVHEDDKSGDLPSDYRLINNIGDTITISGFVYDDHVALNGKKATIYYTNDTTYIATSIASSDSGNYTSAGDSIEPTDNATIQIQKTLSFNSFWENLCTNRNNDGLINESIDYPIFSGDSKNEVIDKEKFTNIFKRFCKRPTSKIILYDGKYINGFLEENFTNKYGNLKNLYVVSIDPTPSGYLLYFKLLDNEYKFVGYESIFIAD
jgi:hypothetical protein